MCFDGWIWARNKATELFEIFHRNFLKCEGDTLSTCKTWLGITRRPGQSKQKIPGIIVPFLAPSGQIMTLRNVQHTLSLCSRVQTTRKVPNSIVIYQGTRRREDEAPDMTFLLIIVKLIFCIVIFLFFWQRREHFAKQIASLAGEQLWRQVAERSENQKVNHHQQVTVTWGEREKKEIINFI